MNQRKPKYSSDDGTNIVGFIGLAIAVYLAVTAYLGS